MTFYDIFGSYFFCDSFLQKLMVGSRYPTFCSCCNPAVLLKNRASKYYHIKMPKSTPSNKKQKISEEFKTPSRSNPSAVQTFINLCAEDGKLYDNAFDDDVETSVKYELKDINFDDKVILAKQLRELISDEKVRDVKKLKHFEETFSKDANQSEEPYLNSLVEKTVTEAGVIVNVSTDMESLLFEKKKLKSFIQVIDDELTSRRNAKSVLVWKIALEEIEKKDLARADNNTSIIRSNRGGSSSSHRGSSSSSSSSSSIRRSSVLTSGSLPALQSPPASVNPVISEAGSPGTSTVANSQI